MKFIGQILLWCGFLSGSLATVFHPPAEAVSFAKQAAPEAIAKAGVEGLDSLAVPEDSWGLIPWGWYGVSAGIAVLGIVLIRAGKQDAAGEGTSTESSIAELVAALESAIAATDEVHRQLETSPPSKIVEGIDHRITEHLRVFADGRDAMTRQYGLELFADVMSQFAAGERAINRAWSASADGYFDEADVCFERGRAFLEVALKLLSGAEKK